MPESMTTTAEPSAIDVYALGRDPGESARLQRQSEELRSDSSALLDRVGLGPGHSAIDLAAGRAGSSSCWPGGSRRADGSWAWTPTRLTSRWPGSSPLSAGWATSASWRQMPGAPGCPRLVRPGARPYPAGQRSRTRRGPGRDGPAGQARRLGGQPGARRRVLAVLPPHPAWTRLGQIFWATA
jgi:hypothetical protein